MISFPDLPTPKQRIAWFINHILVEPVCWVIGVYGVCIGLFAAFEFGFFNLHEYSFTFLDIIIGSNNVQRYDLWYDAYSYSLMIFGAYILILYYRFNKSKKGYLALPVFMITYSLWDFLGIGTNIVNGYSIIWLGISALSLIYYLPLRNLFNFNIKFWAIAVFFGLGILNLQNIFLSYWPFTLIVINNHTILQYMNGISNELTFCILCIASITIKTSHDKNMETMSKILKPSVYHDSPK